MTRYLRAELLLPLVIAGAAAMVAVSEFMTTFEFTAGGEPQAVSLASDRHSYALLILAVLCVAGMAYAVTTGLRAAAIGTAVLGLAALLLFLVLDLPDAGKAGPLDDDPALYFADARADPDTGFWLEAVGTVILGLASVAFATLSSAQLRAPMELLGGRRAKARTEKAEKSGKSELFDSETEDGEEAPEPSEQPKRRRQRKTKTEDKPKTRRIPRERPARGRSAGRPRTASEERAAARERLRRRSSGDA